MDNLTAARHALDNANRRHSEVNPSTYSLNYGRRGTTGQIDAAKKALKEAMAAVAEAEAERLEILTTRAAKHTPGAIAFEDETTQDTLNRWAWIDLNA